MDIKIYKEFEHICSSLNVGGAILEVGAVPSEMSLLNMKCLKNVKEKIGINLDGPYNYNDFQIIKCNANDMKIFEDDRFDTVLCNATLEHDKFFWKTISEIKRVTKSGGVIIIGLPGYTELSIGYLIKKIHFISQYLKRRRDRITQKPQNSSLISLGINYLGNICSITPTFKIHNYPGDYYRFSVQTFKEVFFDGMYNVNIYTIMVPPRIIGSGIMP